MRPVLGTLILALVIAYAVPATAHHSNPLYFDMNTAVTLEGVVLRVSWTNPHVILYLQSKNEKGAMETWVIHGRSPSNAVRIGGLRERLVPGTRITARVWPSRIPLLVNDEETVLPARPNDPRRTSHVVGGGEVRLPNGDVLAFGGGPRF